MVINKTIKTDAGTYVVTGEFSGDELDVIIEVGLNVLLQTGAMNFVEQEDGSNVVQPRDTSGMN